MPSSLDLCTQEAQLAQNPTLTSWMSRMESHLTNSLRGFGARLTEMEPFFIALTARMCKFETCGNSASKVSGSPGGCWPLPGRSDGSTATGSHRSHDTQGHLKKAGIQDVDSIKLQVQMMKNARSAVLLRFLCEQCHGGMSACLRKTLAPTDLPARIHCKTGTTSARLVFDTRTKCQEIVA